MDEYYGKTHNNPIQPEMRVWSFQKSDGEKMPIITTELAARNWDGEAAVWFNAIQSSDKQGTGIASYVLKQITNLADENNVTMYLTAKPYGTTDNALDQTQLQSWYTRNGWKPTTGDTMIRRPTKKGI